MIFESRKMKYMVIDLTTYLSAPDYWNAIRQAHAIPLHIGEEVTT